MSKSHRSNSLAKVLHIDIQKIASWRSWPGTRQPLRDRTASSWLSSLIAVPPKEIALWLRPYSVTLEPPYGIGEKFEATQRCKCTKIAGGKATLEVTNQFKAMPESVRDHVPLIQKLTEGQVTFDLQAGRVLGVELNIDRTLMKHQGEGSSYHFQSWFTEQLIDVK